MEKFNKININGIKLFDFSTSKDLNIVNAYTSVLTELYYQEFPYEIPEVKILKDDIVIDCGGHYGLFSAKAATIAKKVYTFEPSYNTFQYLKLTASLYDNIQIYNKALGQLNTIDKFTECYFSPGSHLSRYNLNENCLFKSEYKIEVNKLDTLFNEQIDFIKIDAEGAEKDILMGAQRLISLYCPKIAIACYHSNNDKICLSNLLLQFNANYKFKKKGDILFAWN